MPGVNFSAIRARISMTQVLDLIGFDSHRTLGDQVRGPCPVHRSTSVKSRSFSANLAKSTFQCFKCGAAGNHLDLWAAITHQSIHEAAIDLCSKLDQEIPWIRKW
jgi:DNA primase